MPVPYEAQCNLAGISLRVSDQLRNVFGRNGRIYLKNHGINHHSGNRRDVSQKIKGQRPIDRRVDDVADPRPQQGVTVGWRIDHRLRGNIGGSARFVFDDNLLAQTLRQPSPHYSRHNVGAPARRESNDPVDCPRRIIERPGV